MPFFGIFLKIYLVLAVDLLKFLEHMTFLLSEAHDFFFEFYFYLFQNRQNWNKAEFHWPTAFKEAWRLVQYVPRFNDILKSSAVLGELLQNRLIFNNSTYLPT